MHHSSSDARRPGRIRRLLVGASVAGALTFGVAAVPSVTNSVAVSSYTVASTNQSAAGLRDASIPVGQGGAGASTATDSSAQKRIPIKPIIDWIKKNAPKILDALKKALKKGWDSFKAWWNGLASWIRWAIDFLASGTLWDLFRALYDYFF